MEKVRQTPEQKRAYHRAYRVKNKAKLHSQEAAWRRTAKGQRHGRRRNWRRHGIDPVKAETALAEHNNGHCQICGTTRPGGTGGWHVDHKHGVNEVRGVLCSGCNRALGYLKDDPYIALMAAVYLHDTAVTARFLNGHMEPVT